jgi:hypothetical protein
MVDKYLSKKTAVLISDFQGNFIECPKAGLKHLYRSFNPAALQVKDRCMAGGFFKPVRMERAGNVPIWA